MKDYTFHVSGTHCPACKILIEDVIQEETTIDTVSVNLAREEINIQCELLSDPEELAHSLTEKLKAHGYELSTTKKVSTVDKKSLMYAVPLGVIILFLFFLIQRSGIADIGFEGAFTPWTALGIGVVASLSTCLAVVGGLILSLSAKISQDASTAKPITFFHIGRLLGFALLGGVLGFIGQAISINYFVTSFLGLIVSLVMIIVGINLLDIFKSTKKLTPVFSGKFFRKLTKIETGKFTPFLVGVATFFLPCGFTQSMQLVALSSGSFLQGSLIMLLFAIGTLPVLGFLSFGSFSFSQSRFAPIFFKTSGVIVIGLGLFALISGLVALGIIFPIFNF